MRRLLRLLRNLVRVQPGRPQVLVGLRAALAVTVPTLILSAAGLQQAGWAGLTGLLVTLADRGGSYQVRAKIMGTVTLLGALVGALAAQVGGPLWGQALLLLAAVGFSSFLRCYSETAGSIGGQLAVIFVASMGAPAATPEDGMVRGVCLFFGGAWTMLQGLVLWPVHPYRPARKGVAAVYDALADAADDLARLTRSCPPARAWADASARHGLIRIAIEDARERLAAVRVGRADESRRGQHLLVLLEMTEPTLGMLNALSTATEVVCGGPSTEEVRRKIARTCEAYAVRARRVAVVVRDPSRRRRDTSPLRFPERRLQQLPVAVAELLGRLRDYIRVGTETAEAMAHGRPSPAHSGGLLSERARRPWYAPLREHLRPDSLVLRHAARSGLVASAALLATRVLGIGQAHWVVLAAIGILQPYSAHTEERALQRGVGTVFGGLLAAGLAGGIDHWLVLLAVIAALTAVSVSLLPLNFGAFQILLTPDLLLLATLHTGNWSIALERSLGVLVAAVLAVGGVRLLWPTSERRRFPDVAAAALRADGHYLRLVAQSASATDAEVNAARRDLGFALLEAEASFERLMAEFRGPAQKLEPAMTLLAYSRRLASAVTALREQRSQARLPEVTVQLSHAAGQALDTLAQSLRAGRAPDTAVPELPSHHGTDDPVSVQLLERVPRQLQILWGAVTRLSEERVLRPA